MASFWITVLATFLSVVIILLILMMFTRPLIKRVSAHIIRIIMTDRYAENLWEAVSAITRFNPSVVVENSLRAHTGGVIERPFGSARKFLNFDGLIFTAAQLSVLPEHEGADVDTVVTIGPRARKPLQIEIPILLGGMGYGVGMSEKAKMAMAIGTAAVGTASNTGEGGFLQSERDLAKYLIVQYHTGKWAKEAEVLQQADAIEIHIGQGASAAAASRIPPEFIKGEARGILGLQPGETALLSSRFANMQKSNDFRKMVRELREQTDGIPIGVKMNMGDRLEQDIDIALQAGVDFISIDGGQAGTKGAAPILEDDFGLPAIYALSRAVHHLQRKKMKDKVSLLIGGGFFTPGDCLKAIALGADAVYMGTAPLWAMTHTQVNKSMPFEPPTSLVFYSGSRADEFDEQEAAHYLANFLNSCVEEMKVATLALGKKKIKDVCSGDLVALDEQTSQVTGIPLAYHRPQI